MRYNSAQTREKRTHNLDNTGDPWTDGALYYFIGKFLIF